MPRLKSCSGVSVEKKSAALDEAVVRAAAANRVTMCFILNYFFTSKCKFIKIPLIIEKNE